MDMIIAVIVHAKDQEEAYKKGEDVFERFTEEENLFDYYMTFEGEEDDWKGRWSHLPAVVLAQSPEGTDFIEEGWRLTVDGFMDAFEHVKLALQYLSPEEIMERTYPEDLPEDIKRKINVLSIQAYFGELSNRPRYPKFLYHEQEPILSKRDLESALKPEEGLNVYVIPAYVHY